MKTKPDANFILDEHSILRKTIKLKYTVEHTIVIPKKLTNLIILEFHNAKGHKGISCTANMKRCYFWWIGMQRDVHPHIITCKLCIHFLPNSIHAANAFGDSTSAICQFCHGLHWTAANSIKGTQICTNIHLLTNLIFNYSVPEDKKAGDQGDSTKNLTPKICFTG